MNQTKRQNKIWLHRGQKIAYLIGAKEEYGVCPRAWGKTQGPFALRTIRAANLMPRGATGLLGTTYMQLLDRTVPPLLKAWEKFGYYEGVHYWFRRFPERHLKIPSALYPVLHPEHSITWWNGHVFHFISQDKPGLANGKNLDAIAADEVRFLNHKRYVDDVAPTNRGNGEHFGHLAEHHMITMYTDMPTSPQGAWIFEKQEQMDTVKCNKAMLLQLEWNKLKFEFETPGTAENRKVYLKRLMDKYAGLMNQLRRGLVYYHEGSWKDNLPILGIDQIKQWRREMMWPVFQASILNRRLVHLENGFYGLFDQEAHTYNAIDYTYIDSLGLHLPAGVLNDCRKDSDIDKDQPLSIGMDHNASINSLIISQHGADPHTGKGRAMKVLKSMYVKAPLRVHDVVEAAADYYAPHPHKVINYYYDHTSLHTDSTRTQNIADIVTGIWILRGWQVNRIYIGQQPRHETRYRMWQVVFTEKDPRFVPCRFNQENAQSVIVSVQRTGVITGKNGYEKDKRPEKNTNYPQEEAPHQSDALDTVYIGMNKHEYGGSPADMDIIII
ncbi:hypothetical protein [Pedobacter ginsengisoli]|uniref:hypothetical protein n=1 Tax=Pedobacter ginsengisoli TaxID=363852 RepID=UPI00255005F1|nr:hypothetical protein [Pedobacter ginsengisoli]